MWLSCIFFHSTPFIRSCAGLCSQCRRRGLVNGDLPPDGAWRGSSLELATPTTDPLTVLDRLQTLIVGPNHRAKPIVPTRSANASSNFRGVSSQVLIH